jgi:hypothetical protein
MSVGMRERRAMPRAAAIDNIMPLLATVTTSDAVLAALRDG